MKKWYIIGGVVLLLIIVLLTYKKWCCLNSKGNGIDDELILPTLDKDGGSTNLPPNVDVIVDHIHPYTSIDERDDTWALGGGSTHEYEV